MEEVTSKWEEIIYDGVLIEWSCLVFVRDWNCDVASLKLMKMRKFKSSTLEKKQETNVNVDNETIRKPEDESIKT